MIVVVGIVFVVVVVVVVLPRILRILAILRTSLARRLCGVEERREERLARFRERFAPIYVRLGFPREHFQRGDGGGDGALVARRRLRRDGVASFPARAFRRRRSLLGTRDGTLRVRGGGVEDASNIVRAKS